jgi:hypothetical protein
VALHYGLVYYYMAVYKNGYTKPSLPLLFGFLYPVIYKKLLKFVDDRAMQEK